MQIHHLNCGTMCPPGGRLFDGTTPGAFARLTCHCLLIETDQGLVLVDTGLGVRDVVDRSRVAPLLRHMNRPRFAMEETAAAQIRRMGFDRRDVRHIIVTHLDFDHAGGIEDFPDATVHVLAVEKAAADHGRGNRLVGKLRYRPQQWDEVRNWALYEAGGGEPWFGFDSVRDLAGLPPEILIVPLRGHTAGHAGVAVDTGRGWLLHAGDAYFHRGEMCRKPRCPPGLRAYQWLMDVDGAARRKNQQRLRRLAEEAWNVAIISSHDAVEFERATKAPSTSADLAMVQAGALQWR